MKLTPPASGGPSLRTRGVVAAAALLLALAAILVAKLEALPFFLAHRVAGIAIALAAFGAAVMLARRFVRPGGLALGSVALPLALVLLVDLAVTPLPYEIAHEAARLPHPEGATAAPQVETSPTFDATHPTAFVTFPYPAGTNVTAMERAAIEAFRRAAWSVQSPYEPSGATGGVGGFGAQRGGLVAYCTFGSQENGPEMSCSLTA